MMTYAGLLTTILFLMPFAPALAPPLFPATTILSQAHARVTRNPGTGFLRHMVFIGSGHTKIELA